MVEQDSEWLKICREILSHAGFEIRLLKKNTEISSTLHTFNPHLIISEIRIGRSDWRILLSEIRACQLFIPTLLLVSMEAIDEVIEAMREGTEDFLLKPVDPKALLFRVKKVLETKNLRNELYNYQSELHFPRDQDYIVGTSQKIQALLGQILKVAITDAKVLITGETGTGKELIAKAVHYNSHRANKPFVKVNCSASPKQLMENQFFGHVKGSYTGADKTVKGLYEEADGGTIFLDEIADLPLALQGKLLKVLEYGEFQKVGGNDTVRVDVRNLAATNKDLRAEIKEGRFREDLFHRLNSFPIYAPPLRERKEDIPLLVHHFLRLYRKELNESLQGFTTSSIQKMLFYTWPGNIRELENRVRQAMINAEGTVVRPKDVLLDQRIKDSQFKSYKEARQEFESNYIRNVLQLTHGNVTEAARLAKKERKDFYDVMRKHCINPKEYKSSYKPHSF